MLRIVSLLALLVLAGFVRLDGLGTPHTYVADEGFYARDGCSYVLHSPSRCGVSGDTTPEHPPLGKWLIGLGIKLDGFDATGWRLASAIAGIATVGLLFVLALRLLASTAAAALAAALLAVEPLHVVQSRIATLDVFVTLFGVTAVLFWLLDRDSASTRLLPFWRLAAGAACGAAVASKWSGVLVLVAVVVLTLLDQRSRAVRALPSIAICLGLVPLVVYCLTYAGRLHGKLLAAPWAHDSLVRALIHRTHVMWSDQTGHFATSAYQSPSWSWPLLQRPVVHYASVSNGEFHEILAIGSPLIWWPGFVAAAVAVVVAVRSRGRDVAAVTVAICVAATYLPWLVLAHGRSFVFLYYMTPVVPFLCLAVGWAHTRLRRRLQVMTPALAVASVLLLGFWWPILTAQPISAGSWDSRVVFDGCRAHDHPQHLPADSGSLPQAWIRLLHGPPPHGWCWV
jgi:dolichyl-phosphate-mannose--protein O-mannosyl transferase